jgi:putative transposase
MRRVAEKYDMHMLGLEVDVDHVHLYVEIPPQQSVGSAVGKFKSLSARYMLQRFPYLRRFFYGGAMWSPSYFARTIGEGVTAEAVRRYIDMHEEKAELGSAQAELFPPRTGARRRRTPNAPKGARATKRRRRA